MIFKKRVGVYLKQRQDQLSYFYAFFLVFITPLALPLTLWSGWQGRLTMSDLYLGIVLYVLSGLGITLGYHRLATHRAFEASPWLKYLLLICGSFAMQGSPASWASLHIQHHRFADKLGDPHSPKVSGFWHAHCGWIFREYRPNLKCYGKWLLKDKAVRHVSKYYLYYSNLGLLLPLLMGGWTAFLSAGLLRLFISSHVTWSVNSVCHRWGRQIYEKNGDESKNNAWVALLSFGEGWHNNHHRYLQMPFLGHRWYQIDMGKWALLLFQKCGWIWDLKIPKGFLSGSLSGHPL